MSSQPDKNSSLSTCLLPSKSYFYNYLSFIPIRQLTPWLQMISFIQPIDCYALLVPLSFGLPTGKITNNSYKIGRAIGCDLIIPELYISRKHATIFRKTHKKSPQFSIVCHSKTKLFINNIPVTDSKSKLIQDDDQIWFSSGRSFIRECPIGYRFKTEALKADLLQMAKYQRELNARDHLVGKVKQVLSCSQCHRVMPVPIGCHPCGHKLCQKCARLKIDSNEQSCNICQRQIVSFFRDPHLSELAEAYSIYRLGGNRSLQVKQDQEFCEEPFIFESQGRVQSIKSLDIVSQMQKGSLQVNKPKRTKRVRWKDKISEQEAAQKGQTGSSLIKTAKKKKNEASNTHRESLSKAKDSEWLDSAIDTASQVNFQDKSSTAPLPMNRSPGGQFIIEQHSDHSPEVNLISPPEKACCFNCNKKFLFSNRNMHLKHCAICLCPFCNVQYPPCRNGQEPLRPINLRIKQLAPNSLLLLIEERFKANVKKVILKNFQAREYCFIFLYVFMKGGGTFEYRRDKLLERPMITLKQEACVCNACWPGLANSLVIQFMKFHREVIKSFSRKDVEAAIQECELYFANSIKEQIPEKEEQRASVKLEVGQQQLLGSQYLMSRDAYREFEL